jgi:putative DNA primase/helicase
MTTKTLDLHFEALTSWEQTWVRDGKIPDGDEEPAMSGLIDALAMSGGTFTTARKAASSANDLCVVRVAEERIYSWLKAAFGEQAQEPEKRKAAPSSEAKPKAAKTYSGTDGEHKSDAGNARRFVAQHGNDIRYCPGPGWLVWDGRRWARDDVGAIIEKAKLTALTLWEGLASLDADQRERAVKWAVASESAPRLTAMVKLSDRKPWSFNVEDGTIDLKTGTLHEHRREDLMTKIAPVKYDPNATCPRWEQFLREIFNDSSDLVLFMQEAIGYTLAGVRPDRIIFLLHGVGLNGKSTLFETVLALMGDYGMATEPETVMQKKHEGGISNDVAQLRGARFVITSETEKGKKLSASRLKKFAGNDTMNARFLHKEFFNFRAVFALWIASNHKPRTDASDQAIWDRLRLVPFNRRFEGKDCEVGLEDTLRAELPGILAWAVRGCRMWQEAGRLESPAEVMAATSKYREEQDAVTRYIDERYERASDAWCSKAAFYVEYRKWATEAGEFPLAQRNVSARMTELGFKEDRTGKDRDWIWRGLRLA